MTARGWSLLRHHRSIRRIAAGMGSNAYAQATTLGIQLASLPLFLAHWDLATYGQWLVLSALPSYLSMADVGMVTAAGNGMTMAVGAGDTARANRLFQSALAFVLCMVGAIAAVVGIAWWLLPASWSPGQGAATAVALLSVGVLVSLLGGLPEAVYKATERYALGAALGSTTRLLEWAGGLVGLIVSGSFIAVALGMLIPRVLCTLAMSLHAARTTPALRWGFADATRDEIRACAAPALSFMAFPAANALQFQGATLVAAALLGPAAAVVFNTYRTLARVTVQATASFSHALWPEFSTLYGRRDMAALGALYAHSRWLGAGLAAGAGAAVYAAAPFVLQAWSHGKVPFLPGMMLAAMAYAAAAGCWHVPRVLLLATNTHGALAWVQLLASALVLPLAAWLALQLGVAGLALALVVLEAAMLLFSLRLCSALLAPPPSVQPLRAAT